MGVTPDVRVDGFSTSGATSLAWNHTVAAGLTNSALAGFGTTGSGSLKRISTYQWDAAGTPVGLTNETFQAETAGNCYTEIWLLVNPSPGTKQLKITPTASCEITGGSASYQYVNQSTPWNAGSPDTTTGGSPATCQITVDSAANEMALACVVENGGSVLTGDHTVIYAENIGAGQHAGAAQDSAGATTVTFAWSGKTVGNTWAAVGGSLQFDPGTAAPAQAPTLVNAMRPTTKRVIGRAALAMRAVLRPSIDSTPAPSTVAQAAASVAMSTAFAVGVAIFSGTGVTTAQSEAQAPGTGIAAGAGVATSQSEAQAPATGIAAGAGVSTSPATGTAGSASTGAGSGATTAQSLTRATGSPTGAGGGCTTAQSTSVAAGSPTGAGSGISSGGGALAVAIGQAAVPGVGGVTVAQSTVVGAGAPTGAGGGCTTTVSSARATSAPTGAGAGASASQSRAVAIGVATSAGVGVSVSQSSALAAQGADIPPVDAAGLVLIPNNGALSLAPNDGRLFLTPNNGALSLTPNDGTLSLIPDI